MNRFLTVRTRFETRLSIFCLLKYRFPAFFFSNTQKCSSYGCSKMDVLREFTIFITCKPTKEDKNIEKAKRDGPKILQIWKHNHTRLCFVWQAIFYLYLFVYFSYLYASLYMCISQILFYEWPLSVIKNNNLSLKVNNCTGNHKKYKMLLNSVLKP